MGGGDGKGGIGGTGEGGRSKMWTGRGEAGGTVERAALSGGVVARLSRRAMSKYALRVDEPKVREGKAGGEEDGPRRQRRSSAVCWRYSSWLTLGNGIAWGNHWMETHSRVRWVDGKKIV